MNDIIKVAKRIIAGIPNARCTTETDFNGGYLEEVGDDITVEDDEEGRYWRIYLEVPTTDVKDALTALFGPSTSPREGVNNWEVKKVLIVQEGESVELHREYTKR